MATDGFLNDGTTTKIINMANSVKREWLIQQQSIASNPNNESTFKTLNSGDKIRLLICTDGGTTFTSLALFDSTIAELGEIFSVVLITHIF